MTTKTNTKAPNRRWLVLLLAALAAVLAVLLPAGTASASGLPAAQTRVGAINPTVTVSVGVAEHIAAGQRRSRAPSQLQVVVGNCVAAEAGGGTTKVFRVESPGNARLSVGADGGVAIKGDNTLFLNFGDEARAQSFLGRRLAQGYEGTEIKSFEVPTSYVDELRASSVPERLGRQFPDQPIRVDVNQAADQFGLRACQFPGLMAAIVPGSGC